MESKEVSSGYQDVQDNFPPWTNSKPYASAGEYESSGKMSWVVISKWRKAEAHDVIAAILVFQNNEMVSQTNPVGVQLFSYVNTFFCHVVAPNQSCESSTLSFILINLQGYWTREWIRYLGKLETMIEKPFSILSKCWIHWIRRNFTDPIALTDWNPEFTPYFFRSFWFHDIILLFP